MIHHEIIVSDSIKISAIHEEDAQAIAEQIHDKQIYENTLQVPYPYTLDDANEFIRMVKKYESRNQQQKDWAIRYYGQLIGGIGLLYNFGLESHRSEIGYWISKQYRGKGIMKDVIYHFSEFCFSTYGLTRLEAHVFTNNEASKKVLVNNGFKEEGLIKAAFLKDDEYKDAYLYSKLAPTY